MLTFCLAYLHNIHNDNNTYDSNLHVSLLKISLAFGCIWQGHMLRSAVVVIIACTNWQVVFTTGMRSETWVVALSFVYKMVCSLRILTSYHTPVFPVRREQYLYFGRYALNQHRQPIFYWAQRL